ncbi:unnamed protein product, partial [Mesorhabditis spiculigera]
MQKPKKPSKKPKAAEQEAKPLKPKQKRSLKRFEKQKRKNVRQTVEEIVKEYDSLKEKPTTAFRTFNDFPLSTATKSGLDEAGFITPTEIQRDSLPHSLRGADLIGAAKTGSGKTLALVIPLLENLWRNRWTHDEGFLKRQGIELGKEKPTKPSVEFSAGNGFGDLVDDIAADDLFAVKKKDIFAVEEEAEAEPEEETKPQKKGRILTKEELARKILNKNVKVNTRTVFEDPEDSDGEGEREVDRPAAGPSEGLDIEEAKKEKALKDKTKKTEDDELELGDDDDRSDDEGPDLSWLPKPVGYDSDEEDDLPAEYDPSLDTKLEEKRAKALDKQKDDGLLSNAKDRTEPVTQITRFKRPIYGATYRSDGELIAIGGDEGKLRIFDAQRGSSRQKGALRVAKSGDASLHTIRFSASGKTVFSMADDGVVKQFDVIDTSSEALFSFKAHKDSIRCGAASSANEHLILTGSYDQTVKLWDTRVDPNTAGAQITMSVGAPVENLLYLPNENLIATAAGNTVQIWDILAGGRLLTPLQIHHKTVTSLCLAEHGKVLLTGAIDRRFNVVNLADFKTTCSLTMANPVLAIVISPDDETMAVGQGNLLTLHRRAPEADRFTSLDKTNEKSVMRASAPAVVTKVKGGEKEVVELTAKQADQFYLPKLDRLLRSYEHHKAVEMIFGHSDLHVKKVDYVVGILRRIAYRGALRPAFAGHGAQRQLAISKFLCRNLFVPPYFDTILAVTEAVYEVFAEEEITPKVVHQLNRLRDFVRRELEVQKEISQMAGSLELVLRGAEHGSQAKKIEEDLEVFGAPVVVSLRLNPNATA